MNKKVYKLKDFLEEKISVDLNIFVSIFTQTPNSIFVLDSDFHVCTCNESLYDMFECEDEIEFSKHFLTLFPCKQVDGEFSKEILMNNFANVYKSGKETFRMTSTSMSGKLINTEFVFLKLESFDENGKSYILCYAHDISNVSEEREKEKLFAKRFRALIDATPLCINLWNSKFDNIMCNAKAVSLFNLATEQQYLDEFFKLSPEFQPDGRPSTEAALENIQQAFSTGYVKFKWMHCKLNGDEIPAEITLVKVLGIGENHEDMVAGFTRDLRPQLLGYNKIHAVEEYFFNKISDKTLINIMSKLSEEWFFVVDLNTSTIQYFGNGSKIFDSDNDNTLFPEHLANSGVVYKEDIPEFLRIAENMKTGVPSSAEIRLIALDGSIKYHKFIYQTVTNENGIPMATIGKAVDVNEQKTIEIRSKTDLLTNCYNKITSESLISETLSAENNSLHTLFVIDIDNFKAINDNLGHQFGDLVLSEISESLKTCFRNGDIIGRIGGDEFVAFAHDISDVNIINSKIEKISKAFSKVYDIEQGSYKVSASIGIARYPLDGKTYEELFKAADKALYQSKIAGKNRATFYDSKFMNSNNKNLTTLENASRAASAYLDTELISVIFELLYDAKNISSSLNWAMKLIGEKFNADRVYIFETHNEGETYSNTFEWCNINITSQNSHLKNIDRKSFEFFFKDSVNSVVIYSSDINSFSDPKINSFMKNQEVKSFLHAQVKEKNYVKLYLGLDDCNKPRKWNEKEINTLQYLAKTISTFILLDEERKKNKKK